MDSKKEVVSHLEIIEQLQTELRHEREKRQYLESVLDSTTSGGSSGLGLGLNGGVSSDHHSTSSLALLVSSKSHPTPSQSTHGYNFHSQVAWEGRSVIDVVIKRTSVLIILLLFQSISSSVLSHYDILIHKTIIPLFLTMLVGAGGNAGNQATVRSITGLVSGEYTFTMKDFVAVLRRESLIGLLCALFLTAIGFLRVYMVSPMASTLLPVYTISFSLFIIVCSSSVIGATLPFILRALRIDPETAGPAIQVIMDILGVCITCVIAQKLLLSSGSSSGSLPISTEMRIIA